MSGLMLPLFHFKFLLLGLPSIARRTCLLHFIIIIIIIIIHLYSNYAKQTTNSLKTKKYYINWIVIYPSLYLRNLCNDNLSAE